MKKENSKVLGTEKKTKEVKKEIKVATPDQVLQPDASIKNEKPTKITKVGSMLKEMRQEKGIKLADVAKQLCIRKSYIEAIENNDASAIPPFPYGIGFIRSYAKFLGLNSENIVELYKEENKGDIPQDIKVLEPQTEASFPKIQYLIISIVALFLLYIGWFLLNKEDEPVVVATPSETDVLSSADDGVIVVEDYSTQPIAKEEVVIEEDAAPATSNKQIKISDESYPLASDEPAEKKDNPAESSDKPVLENTENTSEIPTTGIYIEVLDETWIEVKDDTKLYISKVLQKGDSYKVPEGPGMILSAGKSDSINVYVNGVLTQVVRPNKKMNISLDDLVKENH